MTEDLQARAKRLLELCDKAVESRFTRDVSRTLRDLLAALEAAESARGQLHVTRFEVIDHREPEPQGRVVVANPCRVELSYQDGGRTLKAFISNALPSPPEARPNEETKADLQR